MALLFEDDFVGAAGSIAGRAATGASWGASLTGAGQCELNGSGECVVSAAANDEGLHLTTDIASTDDFTFSGSIKNTASAYSSQNFLRLKVYTSSSGSSGDYIGLTLTPGSGSQYFVQFLCSIGGSPEVVNWTQPGSVGTVCAFEMKVNQLAGTVEVWTAGVLRGTIPQAPTVAKLIPSVDIQRSATGSAGGSVLHMRIDTAGPPPPTPDFWTNFVNTREVA